MPPKPKSAPESEANRSGNLVVNPLLRAQPEHAIGKSRPAGTAKNYYRPGDAERTTNIRMTADQNSRNSEPHTERHSQVSIHFPKIPERCHSYYPTASAAWRRRDYLRSKCVTTSRCGALSPFKYLPKNSSTRDRVNVVASTARSNTLSSAFESRAK